jgi:hypothetical protein
MFDGEARYQDATAACAWAQRVSGAGAMIHSRPVGYGGDHGDPMMRPAAGRTKRRSPFHGTDFRLLTSIQHGQVAGLAGLYDRHGSHCLSLANELLASEGAAEDVVFDVFMGFWRSPGTDRTGRLRQHLARQTVAACVADGLKRNLGGPLTKR